MNSATMQTTADAKNQTNPKRLGSLALVGGLLVALVALVPSGLANATTSQEVVGERIAAGQETATDRYDILRRGALLIEWGSGYEDVQTILGGWLEMNGINGHGELIVRDANGITHTHQITDAYPAMGGLGFELDVRSGGMFPQVVTFSTAAAGSPLYQGPDGGYEGDLEDWAGINEIEVFSLTFQHAS